MCVSVRAQCLLTALSKRFSSVLCPFFEWPPPRPRPLDLTVLILVVALNNTLRKKGSSPPVVGALSCFNTHGASANITRILLLAATLKPLPDDLKCSKPRFRRKVILQVFVHTAFCGQTRLRCMNAGMCPHTGLLLPTGLAAQKPISQG